MASSLSSGEDAAATNIIRSQQEQIEREMDVRSFVGPTNMSEDISNSDMECAERKLSDHQWLRSPLFSLSTLVSPAAGEQADAVEA